MMKRIVVGVVFIAGAATSLAALGNSAPLVAAQQSSKASGSGSMTFGVHGDAVGLIEFDVDSVSPAAGALLFAAENHDSYPHTVVRMEQITQAKFGPRSVRFSGKGTLHDEPVSVAVAASDGDGTADPDTFSIRCTNGAGAVVLEADGELFSGDISIGESS